MSLRRDIKQSLKKQLKNEETFLFCKKEHPATQPKVLNLALQVVLALYYFGTTMKSKIVYIFQKHKLEVNILHLYSNNTL